MVFSNGKGSISMKELSKIAGEKFEKELLDLETETENRNYPFFDSKPQKADFSNFKAEFEKYEKKYLENQKKLKKV